MLCAMASAAVLLTRLSLARNIPTAKEGPPRRSELSGRAPELQFEVEWRVAVGCDWSGFFISRAEYLQGGTWGYRGVQGGTRDIQKGVEAV